jgi:hypothetical protein
VAVPPSPPAVASGAFGALAPAGLTGVGVATLAMFIGTIPEIVARDAAAAAAKIP